MKYFGGLWNGCLLEAKMDPVNLDKLGGIAKRAFTNAAIEKRKALLKETRGKQASVKASLGLSTPGAEFYVWNEGNVFVSKRNCNDPWYQLFFECHTQLDGYAQRAAEMLNLVGKKFSQMIL